MKMIIFFLKLWILLQSDFNIFQNCLHMANVTLKFFSCTFNTLDDIFINLFLLKISKKFQNIGKYNTISQCWRYYSRILV